jgi:hypothetical protein
MGGHSSTVLMSSNTNPPNAPNSPNPFLPAGQAAHKHTYRHQHQAPAAALSPQTPHSQLSRRWPRAAPVTLYLPLLPIILLRSHRLPTLALPALREAHPIAPWSAQQVPIRTVLWSARHRPKGLPCPGSRSMFRLQYLTAPWPAHSFLVRPP